MILATRFNCCFVSDDQCVANAEDQTDPAVNYQLDALTNRAVRLVKPKMGLRNAPATDFVGWTLNVRATDFKDHKLLVARKMLAHPPNNRASHTRAQCRFIQFTSDKALNRIAMSPYLSVEPFHRLSLRPEFARQLIAASVARSSELQSRDYQPRCLDQVFQATTETRSRFCASALLRRL